MSATIASVLWGRFSIKITLFIATLLISCDKRWPLTDTRKCGVWLATSQGLAVKSRHRAGLRGVLERWRHLAGRVRSSRGDVPALCAGVRGGGAATRRDFGVGRLWGRGQGRHRHCRSPSGPVTGALSEAGAGLPRRVREAEVEVARRVQVTRDPSLSRAALGWCRRALSRSTRSYELLLVSLSLRLSSRNNSTCFSSGFRDDLLSLICTQRARDGRGPRAPAPGGRGEHTC